MLKRIFLVSRQPAHRNLTQRQLWGTCLQARYFSSDEETSSRDQRSEEAYKEPETEAIQEDEKDSSESTITPKIESNLYKQLGIEQTANQQEVREAYMRIVREYHPDRAPEHQEYFQAVNKAYETLYDEVQRANYDEDLWEEEASTLGGGQNKLWQILGGSLFLVGAFCAGQIYSSAGGKKEGACPVDHTARQQMVDMGRKQKQEKQDELAKKL